MGTIAEKLSYLADTKELFKDRLNSLGAEITSSTTFRNYLTWLDTFYGEVSDKTDLSQNGIVGRTSQDTTTGKNYLNPVPSDTTTGGITTTANTDTGYVTMVGTSDRNYPWILKADTNIPSGTTLIVSSNSQYTMYARLYYDNSNYETMNTSSSQSITVSHNIIRIAILANMPTGTSVNETCYIQIEEGSTATSFEKFTYGPSPNPDYPQPINNLSGDVEYKVSGKNLIGLGTQLNGYRDTSTSKFQTNTNAIGYYFKTSDLPDTITFTGTNSNRSNISYYNETPALNVSSLDYSNSNSTPRTINVDKTYQYIHIQFSYNQEVLDIQVEEGNSATDFEPYIEPQTFTIPLGDIELCKIDTYEDKIYSSDGRFYLYKETGKSILNGSENWTYFSVAQGSLFRNNNVILDEIKNNTYVPYSKYYQGISYNNYQNRQNNQFYINSNNNFLDFIDNRYTTANDFKTWLSTHNTIVYYLLNTPTTTEITQENYPSLYNALKQIQDYLTSYKINKEFILGYSSPEIEY